MTFGDLPAFNFWIQKVLPLVYDDSLTYYEVLSKVINTLNEIIENDNNMATQVKLNASDIAELKTGVAKLETELEKVKNGDYVSLYLDSIKNWIDNNLQNLVAKIVKFVVFGLTDDGRFVAYIPSTWDFLKFDTIVDTTSDLYGHLLMKW